MELRNVTNVRRVAPGSYVCNVEINLGDGWETVEFAAVENDITPSGQWVYDQIMLLEDVPDIEGPGQYLPEVLPPPDVVIVPQAVTPRQIRLALDEIGLLSSAEAFVAAAGGALQIEWEYAIEIKRDHPAVLAFATAAGKTEEEVDALFISAAGK